MKVKKSERRPFFVSVAIPKFSTIEVPCLGVEVDGRKLSMEVDLGYRGEIAILENAANAYLEKTFVREKTV